MRITGMILVAVMLAAAVGCAQGGEDVEPTIEHRKEAVNQSETRLFLLASYVQLDQQDDAEWEVTQLEISHPELTLSHLQQVLPITDTELRDRLVSDLRSAGLAE